MMTDKTKDSARADGTYNAADEEDDVQGHIRRPTLGDGVVAEDDDVQGHLKRI
jgi:hypothetical protein